MTDVKLIRLRVPGSEYEVDTDGRVWSPHTGLQLKPSLAGKGKGHWSVSIRINGRTRRVYVHTLVLTTFVGPRPTGMEACHNSGDRDDNRLANLRWDTRQANVRDAEDHGQRMHPVLPGEKNGRAKLSSDQANEIRRMSIAGISRSELSRRFGVTRAVVRKIATGMAWKLRGEYRPATVAPPPPAEG